MKRTDVPALPHALAERMAHALDISVAELAKMYRRGNPRDQALIAAALAALKETNRS